MRGVKAGPPRLGSGGLDAVRAVVARSPRMSPEPMHANTAAAALGVGPLVPALLGLGLLGLATVSGCASGGDGSTRDASGGGLDASPLDAGALDAPSVDLDAHASDDAFSTDDAPFTDDAARADASVGGDAFAMADAFVGSDAFVAPDARSGPVACTAMTAGAVCGGRPCVDGYCCSSACAGPCDSCAIPGLEGSCTAVPGIACDDGDACTHGDLCGAGGTCAGTAIACDAMDTACLDYSCTGGSTCAMAARTGASCDDGDATTSGDACRADGTCAGMPSGCTLPTNACDDGTETRDRCTGARVIGRRSAASMAGFTVTGDTCTASNRFDDCSWDAGNDHAYRLWLRAGEVVSARIVSRSATCYVSSASITLKLYQATGCSDVTCAGDLWCDDFVGTESHTYTAPRDGWVVLVVDGSTAFEDEGRYTLNVTLRSCATAGCEC